MTGTFEQLRALAISQLACIENDDIEGYLAGADAFEASLAACAEGSDGLDRDQLEELGRIERVTRERLNHQKEDVARQLTGMNGNRRASAAYLATSPTALGDARSA